MCTTHHNVHICIHMYHYVLSIFVQDNLKKIEQRFGKEGQKLRQMKPKEFTDACGWLYQDMKTRLDKTSGAALLKDYSPWLNSFQASNYADTIEIPGTVIQSVCEWP